MHAYLVINKTKQGHLCKYAMHLKNTKTREGKNIRGPNCNTVQRPRRSFGPAVECVSKTKRNREK